MTETFAALLFAHILADFVLQTRWIAANKRRSAVLLLHAALVWLSAQAALGIVAWPLLALAAAHLAIDAAKAWAPKGLGTFLIDQGAHLATLAATAALFPGLWASGAWAALPAPAAARLLEGMVLAGGLILATRAGGFAVGLLMDRHTGAAKVPDGDAVEVKGLPEGGWTIGILERGLIFAFVLAGQHAAIGFLIAAKSILRFGDIEKHRAVSEYVIIGTLASFGWALFCAYGTGALMTALAGP